MIGVVSVPRPYVSMGACEVYCGNACDILPHLSDVAAVVSDPPWYLHAYPIEMQSGVSAVDHAAEVEWLGKLWLFYASWMTLVQRAGARCGWYFVSMDHAPMFLRVARVIGWTVQHAWQYGQVEWLFYLGPLPLSVRAVSDVEQSIRLYGAAKEKPYLQLVQLLALSPSGTVLDPFCGSGSVLVAAHLLGRRAIGIDVNEDRCKQAAHALDDGTCAGAPPPVGPAWHMIQKVPLGQTGGY